jgi:hypothetical protein
MSQPTSQIEEEGMNKRKSILVAAIGLAAVAVFSVTALATAGSGFHPDPNPALRGTLPNDIHLNADRIKFQTKGAADVGVQTITVDGGGNSGWHTHPGFVLAVLQKGSVSITVGCSTTTYTVGQSFYETGTTPIIARNASATQEAIVRATYIVPKGSPTRLEANPPTC